MNITNEALKEIVTRAYEQGYSIGYDIGISEKLDNKTEFTYGDIYNEFRDEYQILPGEVIDYRPYRPPYTNEQYPMSILLYFKDGTKKRYSHIDKTAYDIDE